MHLWPKRHSLRVRPGLAAAFVLAIALASCSSLSIEPKTQTSGTFTSSGFGFTILSWDFPKSALDIARENASDARLTNIEVQRTRVFPYLGPLDWIFDIIGFRYATISGTWGFPGKR